METFQVNVTLLGNFDLYTKYLHFFQILFKSFIFQLFSDKILKIVFRVYKIQEILAENG